MGHGWGVDFGNIIEHFLALLGIVFFRYNNMGVPIEINGGNIELNKEWVSNKKLSVERIFLTAPAHDHWDQSMVSSLLDPYGCCRDGACPKMPQVFQCQVCWRILLDDQFVSP